MKSIKALVKLRLFYVLVGISGLFGILIYQFYKLQIIEHEVHVAEVLRDTHKLQNTEAMRGLIFDRYGKPLAVNRPLYVLNIDQQVKLSKKALNQVLLDVARVLEANGDTYKDEVPISAKPPFTFIEDAASVKKFISSIPYHSVEHRNKLLELSADELITYLGSKDVFTIDERYTAEEARKIIAMRHQMYQLAYQKYKKITIAQDLSDQTIAMIQEHQEDFPGIVVDVTSYRYYPYGQIMGNILGYTRKIIEGQYETYQSKGYDMNDVIGQMGIEQTMEETLRGQKGEMHIEVDNLGRTVNVIEEILPTQGNDLFLTIDAALQVEVYNAIERHLADAIIARLEGTAIKAKPIQARELLVSMVESNQLEIKQMSRAEESSMQYQLYQKVQQRFEATRKEKIGENPVEDMSFKGYIVALLEHDPNFITDRELLITLAEQGSLVLEETTVKRLWKGNEPNTKAILIQALKTGGLKPSQMAIEPFSASSVVVDVSSGDVLALVGYPSYDNNQLISNFNAYYTMLQDGIDQRNLLWNRAMLTVKAPGSTFKMISALAGLESGVVNEHTAIHDEGPYPHVGTPEPRCWFFTNNGYGHGAVDIKRALEVSCNYYFYELAYRMGRMYGTPYGASSLLTEYATMFGLDEKTGIELQEGKPNISNPENLVQSQISKSLHVMRNLTDNGQVILDEVINERLVEGIYPEIVLDKDTQATPLIKSLEKEIKHEIDEAFSSGFEEVFKKINQSLTHDIKQAIENSEENLEKHLTQKVFETDSKDLKQQTKKVVGEFFNQSVSYKTRQLMRDAVKKAGTRFIQSTYEDAIEDIRDNPQIYKFTEQQWRMFEDLDKAIQSGAVEPPTILATILQVSLVESLIEYLFESATIKWNDGINVRTAIGQGNNAFAPVQIARYIAALANGEKVHSLKLVGGMKDYKEEKSYEAIEDKVLKTLEISKNSLEIVHEGMYEVVHGKEGTVRHEFATSKTTVAGKTGTAQETGTEHSWFAGFAPYDQPKVAVVTTIYDAKGLGTYNYSLANEIFNQLFTTEESESKAVMEPLFIE